MRSSLRGSVCHKRQAAPRRALGLDRLHQAVKEEHLGPARKQLLRAQQGPSGAVIVAYRLDLEEARAADLVAPRQRELDPLPLVAGKLHQAQVEVLGEARHAARHPREGVLRDGERQVGRGRLRPERAERHALVPEAVEQRLGHVRQPSPFDPTLSRYPIRFPSPVCMSAATQRHPFSLWQTRICG